MIEHGIHAFRGKRVLLLQGPVGPFFHRLAKDLSLAGAQVFKVNFNGGDLFFFPAGAINFRGRMEEWPAFFEELLDSLDIDMVLLFGDCRPIHQVASEIVNRKGLDLGVFELGYIRPDYVTLERFGVNGHSKLPRNPAFYLNYTCRKNSDDPVPVGNTYWQSVLWACLYYLAASLLKPVFWRYVHHRPLTLREVLPWVGSIWRKVYYAVKEHGFAAKLMRDYSGWFFLVPLQVHNDAQVQVHSNYDSVAHFIRHTVASFAANAPQRTVLVIKHHPMDRAYHDYIGLIRELIAEHSLQNRCFYIHDQHLPSLLKHARGVVVVNSTVALSALFHKAPVKACGKAIYDMEGLTFQGPLARFWRQAHLSRPNRQLYLSFVAHLIHQTQLNGSFYKRIPGVILATGLRWENRSPSSGKSTTPVRAGKLTSFIKDEAS
jgi:capsular polysaccharide export protein